MKQHVKGVIQLIGAIIGEIVGSRFEVRPVTSNIDIITRKYHVREEQMFSQLFQHAMKNGLSSLTIVPDQDMRLKIIEYIKKRMDSVHVFEDVDSMESPGIHIVSDVNIEDVRHFRSVGIVNAGAHYENDGLVKDSTSNGVPILVALRDENLNDYWIGSVEERIIPDYPKVATDLRNEKIREMFLASFSIAEDEIDIISPWINGSVVNDNLKSLMENVLERGVRIRIKYGIGDGEDRRSQTSEDTVEELRRRFSHYKDRLMIRNTNTHEKLLLCDDKYMMFGSYNFLSFAGDYEGTDIRAESVRYDVNKTVIAQQRIHHFSW